MLAPLSADGPPEERMDLTRQKWFGLEKENVLVLAQV